MVEKETLCAPDSFFSVLPEKKEPAAPGGRKKRAPAGLMRSFATPSAGHFASGSRRCPGREPTLRYPASRRCFPSNLVGEGLAPPEPTQSERHRGRGKPLPYARRLDSGSITAPPSAGGRSGVTGRDMQA